MKYDLHNYKLKFNMTHAHSFRDGKEVRMRGNWSAFYTKYKGYTIQVNLKSLLIWSKKRYKTNNLQETSDKIIKDMTKVTIEFCEKNDIKIIQIPIPVGKEIKVLNYKVDGNFITPNVKAVYPKPSPVEFTKPSRAEKDALQYVLSAKEISLAMTSWSTKMDFYASNYAAHVEAIRELKDAVVELRKAKPTIWQRIKRLFK